MVKQKQEVKAIRQKKLGKVETAVRNTVIELRKMGLHSADVKIDESGTTAYILFKVDDVVNLIQKKARNAVKKAAGDTVEVVCYTESDVIVVRVRK
ncbi:MAG: hypothetical protein DRJ98_08930 [Thermoprotei archaeon]|nr:MAG: hypothetical protein DRJ98_08930 [Thermoprotei archaeon]